jgi:hypothetical protein
MRLHTIAAVSALLASCGAGPALAQDVKLVPAPHQAWTAALAGSKHELKFTIQAPKDFRGRLVWSLAEKATGRVLPDGRGEAVLKRGAGGTATASFALDFPKVSPGVVLKAQLTASLVDDAAGTAAATYEKPVRIFHPNPFVNQLKVLSELKIVLYDPDPAARTTSLLKELEVAFEEEKNLAALVERKAGVVIVGEGVSFKEEPGMAETLLKLARHGQTVLCLAPAAGTLPVPGTERDGGEDVSFFRRDIIKKLDKRLDTADWSKDGQVIASTLALKAVEGSVVAEVVAGSGGWPWLQVDYPESKGRLIVCGFAVVAQWQANPTPRYLLAKMLEPPSEPRPSGSGPSPSRDR